MIGVRQSFISRWEKGVLPTADILLRIATGFGTSVEWLLTGEGPRPSGKIVHHNVDTAGKCSEFALVPLYRVAISAGKGREVLGEEEEGQVAFRRAWLARELHVSPPDLVVLFVEGDSMIPSLNPGDLALVEKLDAKPTRDGVYVYRLGNALQVKRFQFLPGGNIKVTSDNPSYSPVTITPARERDGFHILGRIVWAGRKM